MIVARRRIQSKANFGLNLKALPYKQKMMVAGAIGGIGSGVVGAGTVLFMRRRRTKNGKVIVEQVRRK